MGGVLPLKAPDPEAGTVVTTDKGGSGPFPDVVKLVTFFSTAGSGLEIDLMLSLDEWMLPLYELRKRTM